MDAIQRMIQDINPVPDPEGHPERLEARRPETLLPFLPDPAAEAPDTEDPAGGIPAEGRWTAAQWTGLGLAAAVVAAVVGIGVLVPRPTPPVPPASTPTLSAPVTPVTTPAPTSPETSPAADPSSVSAECSVSRIDALPAGPYPVPTALRDRPDDFRVLGCTNGWMAFALTEDGKKYWVDQGLAPDISRTFLYARLSGGYFIHTMDLATHDWSIPPAADAAERQRAMESAFTAAGIPVENMQGLIGTPPEG